MNQNSQEIPTFPPKNKFPFSFVELLIRHKLFLILGLAVTLIIFLIFFSSIKPKPIIPSLTTPSPSSGQNVTPTTTSAIQLPFRVLSTSPKNNESNVFSGELFITLITDVPIIKQDSISLDFSPALSRGVEYKNKFPSEKIEAIALGGLKPNTTYTASVLDKNKRNIFTWSFTTSSDRGEGQSALSSKLDKDLSEKYYPLAKYFPYSTQDYKLGYSDRLKLKITLINPSTDKNRVLEEVKNWIKSKNIDPNTHSLFFEAQ